MNKENKMKTQTYRNTKQRTRILEVLCKTDSHPTANWIYDQLKPEFPSLSLGTIYRNLGILEEQGLLKKLRSGSTFDRYDAVIKPHTHFCCTECGSIIDMRDVEIPDMLQAANKQTKHNIREINLSYMGICDECMKKKS
jgi:Fur family transcriptional regulator, peroxide stress response regulator